MAGSDIDLPKTWKIIKNEEIMSFSTCMVLRESSVLVVFYYYQQQVASFK